MKSFLLTTILFLLFSYSSIFAQDVASRISGAINTYTKVEDINQCSSILTVSNTDGFEPGMHVLLIQMKGATIKEGNNDDFGKIESLNNCGRFEINTIESISGTNIFMLYNITNEYTRSGSIQLVSVPEYNHVEVDDILTGEAWDGTKGGVIALKVNETLTLSADIDATGLGFRGGQITPHENPCTGGVNNAGNFHYERGNWRGSEKGEGVAEYIEGKEFGKGPQANGGGGGNDHNSGGGGGANVTSAGQGGERVTGFITTGCKGKNPGMAGRALSADNTRIFLGGGGGSGHSNNTAGTSGGNGGGIVIIQANEIVANGNRIISNGESVIPTGGADGGGGGGAGGTVVLDVNQLDNSLMVVVEGGNGGNVDHKGIDQCYGPGGGGSGGRFLNLTGTSVVPMFMEAGFPGIITNSTGDCNGDSNEASSGTAGLAEVFSGITQGDDLGGEFAILEQPMIQEVCPDQVTILEVVAQGSGLEYQWQVNTTGNGFTDIQDNHIYSGGQSGTLTIQEITEEMMDDQYLLVISSDCATNTLVTQFISLTEGDVPVADFSANRNGLNLSVNNNSLNAESYLWDFGDGNTSNLVNPSHVYEEDGNYLITLLVFNGCGEDSMSQEIYAGTPPSAAFSANQTEGCATLSVQYANASTSNSRSFLWLFEGGMPGTSTAQDPVVTYSSGGSYNVTLIVSNPEGTDTLEQIDYIFIDAGPGTSFFTTVNELKVDFNNTTVNADSYRWDFGDGIGNSTEPNPTYTYSEEGEYMVTLIATNECGSKTFSQNITTGLLPNADFTVANGTGCTPTEVSFIDQSSGTNVSGFQWEFEGGTPATSTEANPIITYEEEGQFEVKLTVANNLGSSTVMKEGLVNIYNTPMADFTYEIDRNLVTFTNHSTSAVSFGWNFGNGRFSNAENPSHVFSETGVFYVTLNVSNPSCGNSITIPVVIEELGVVDIEDFIEIPSINIFPNPVTDLVNIELENAPNEALQFRIFNANGQLIQTTPTLQHTDFQIDMSTQAAGLYFIQIIADDWQTVERIVKK